MKTNTAEQAELQWEPEQPNIGWRPHPDFKTYSDAELISEQDQLAESLRWTKEVNTDPVLIAHLEIEMGMLQAERARRNGGSQFVSSLIENKSGAINFPLQTWGLS